MSVCYGKILSDKYRFKTILKDDVCVTTEPLVMLGFGRIVNSDHLPSLVDRPHGRLDYQMIYICKGVVDFKFDNQIERLSAHSLVIYRPNEPQYYLFNPEIDSCYFYMHFSGSEVENILQKYELTEQVYTLSVKSEWFEIFFNLMDTHYSNIFREGISNNLLETLLGILGGEIRFNTQSAKTRFQALLKTMEETCTQNLPLSYYANLMHYSETHFIRYFKKRMYHTPHYHLTKLRMEHAKTLLITTEYSIQDIAMQSGFPNARYFSRLFYKQFFMTPTNFRNTETKLKQ